MSRAQERSTAIRAERVPAFSSPWGLLATTPTSGTGPKTLPNANCPLPLAGRWEAGPGLGRCPAQLIVKLFKFASSPQNIRG
jgi:hypothetical protein